MTILTRQTPQTAEGGAKHSLAHHCTQANLSDSNLDIPHANIHTIFLVYPDTNIHLSTSTGYYFHDKKM